VQGSGERRQERPDVALAPLVDRLGGHERQVRDERVAGVERQVQALRGSVPGSSSEGANDLSVSVAANRRIAFESMRSPRYGWPGMIAGFRTADGGEARGATRPRRCAPRGRPVQVEARQREDLRRGAERVLEDSRGLRRLAEEVALALARLEPRREDALARERRYERSVRGDGGAARRISAQRGSTDGSLGDGEKSQVPGPKSSQLSSVAATGTWNLDETHPRE
jgi:hypothetical protein